MPLKLYWPRKNDNFYASTKCSGEAAWQCIVHGDSTKQELCSRHYEETGKEYSSSQMRLELFESNFSVNLMAHGTARSTYRKYTYVILNQV